MDVSGTPIEVVIGPYEVYTDTLYGTKTAFEAFVTVQDPRESARSRPSTRRFCPTWSATCRSRNATRISTGPSPRRSWSPTRSMAAATMCPGVQTIAFNLPNDERVREAKGAKKVILANVLGAKYDRILAPMAALVLVPEQARLVTKKYMTNETLFHELSHSLGPGTITRRRPPDDGQCRAEGRLFGERGSQGGRDGGLQHPLHDEAGRASGGGARAGAGDLFRRDLPGGPLRNRRGARPRRGDAIQLSEGEGRVSLGRAARTASGSITTEWRRACATCVAELVRLQGNGDYAGTKAFFERYARLDERARAVLATTAHIPTDIQPVYPDRV